MKYQQVKTTTKNIRASKLQLYVLSILRCKKRYFEQNLNVYTLTSGLQVTWHRALSFFMFFVSMFVIATVWIYGLCLMDSEKCSYEKNISINKALAGVLLFFGVIGISTSVIGLSLVRRYGPAFGIFQVTLTRNGLLRQMTDFNANYDEIQRRNNLYRQAHGQTSPEGGVVNFAFVPPTPPPYSETDVQISVISDTTLSNSYVGESSSDDWNSPPKYGRHLETIPLEPPPPYSELATERRSHDVQNSDSSSRPE